MKLILGLHIYNIQFNSYQNYQKQLEWKRGFKAIQNMTCYYILIVAGNQKVKTLCINGLAVTTQKELS